MSNVFPLKLHWSNISNIYIYVHYSQGLLKYVFLKSTFKRVICKVTNVSTNKYSGSAVPVAGGSELRQPHPHPCEQGDVLLSSDGKTVLKDLVFLLA